MIIIIKRKGYILLFVNLLISLNIKGILHTFGNNNSNRRMFCSSIGIGFGNGNIIWVLYEILKGIGNGNVICFCNYNITMVLEYWDMDW